MKKLFLAILTLVSLNVNANSNIGGDTCIASNGMKIIVGQDIILGKGSGLNGMFVFVYTAPGFTTPINCPAGWAGYKMKVKEVREMGTKKRGYKKILILGGGNIVNYWMDLEEAIASGELRVPNEYKESSDKNENTISIADELNKLNKLLQDSIITKEEFEIQKSKLLNK